MIDQKKRLGRVFLVTLVLAMAISSVGCSKIFGDGSSTAKVTPEPGFPETDVSEKISIHPSYATSWDAYFAVIEAELPGYELEFSTTNEKVTFLNSNVKDEKDMYSQFTCTVSGDALANGDGLCITNIIPDSKEFEPGQYELDGSPIEIRLVIRDGERVAGYGLLAMWDAVTNNDGILRRFDSMHVIKAVLFDEVEGEYPVISEEKLQSLIDAARQTLIVDAGLFEADEQ